ncbi:MAG: hypothetical protein WC521_01560 [Bdellovibrionales bacterium]
MKSALQTSLIPQAIDHISTEFDSKFAPYQRMATVIIDLTHKNGGCLPQDLLLLGFSKEEIDELWHMANAMADVEQRLMKNNDGRYRKTMTPSKALKIHTLNMENQQIKALFA